MSVVRMRKGENEFVGGIVFHKRVKKIIDELVSSSKLTIDLNGLYLDSSVIGTLLAIHASCRRKDCELELINISLQTRKIIHLSGLDKILEIESPDPAGAGGTV